jgi:signal transduction histidine kinase
LAARLVEAHRQLAARKPALLRVWRRRFHAELAPPAAVAALEQLLFPGKTTVAALWEQVHYSAARLAKLNVPLARVHEALSVFQPLAAAALRPRWSERQAGAITCQWQQEATVAVAQAYVAAHSNAVQALVAVLDAELNANDLDELLQRLLRQAAQLFPLRWGEVLLMERGGRLRHAAAYGLAPEAISANAGAGTFFRDVVREARPGFLADAAHDPRLRQPYYRALDVKSLWAVPLIRRHPRAEVLGVLAVAFDRVYECLPQERDLLLALAERSTLALERTRMTERLNQQRHRVLELSRRLLDAQDEERRRISRDLHDETGQALMALRLYLEMGLREAERPQARLWMKRGLDLVDTSVAELRRILAQLSPLLLDELGLEAALRLELRRLKSQNGWRARFRFAPPPQRLERGLEILVYRVVLEGMRNIARHARARNVALSVAARDGQLLIQLTDDGVGLPAEGPARPRATAPTHFGLAGMRERVRLAGGHLELGSARGRGLRLSISIPLGTPQETPLRAAHAS